MNPEAVGLSVEEAREVRRLVGREPEELEWGLFGALWSEHCSYKSSKRMLSWLPKEGPDVVSGPGGNAGVVRLDDKVEVAFKVESHNHPSYVEPVQGAATGVGGIIRDIVAMGARPIALMDSLRFGEGRNALRLRHGVVAGVGGYANAIGVPTVGGEVYYGPGYDKNPLVNVLCVGVRDAGAEVGARGAKPGQTVYLIGQSTGRDGIHGASLLASRDFSAEDQDMRPTVQVGDPYTGKLLMEATLAAIRTGGVAAVQDLGAAGLASATSELAVQSGVGLDLNLDRVPCREVDMTAYDIMLSETQERMLLVLNAEYGAKALDAIAEWGLIPHAIGQVTGDGRYRLTHGGQVRADLQASWLVEGCPLAPAGRPDPTLPPSVSSVPVSLNAESLTAILADPDCRDRRPIYQRYDSMIQTGTVWGPEHDVAVLSLKQASQGLALAVSGPGRWAAVDPYAGGMAAVALVVSRLATQAATPLGLTDGLNAGNPDKPEVKKAFEQVVLGIRDAARALNVPVTGGNVSFHNETDGEAIWPTPVIGGVGRHKRPAMPVPDVVLVPGTALMMVNVPLVPSVAGSVWERRQGALSAFPRVRLRDLETTIAWLEMTLTQKPAVLRAVRAIADGGAWLALVRMWLGGADSLGMSVRLGDQHDGPARLLCEEPGQFLVAVSKNQVETVAHDLENRAIRAMVIGECEIGQELQLDLGTEREPVGRWSRRQLITAWQSWEGGRSVARTS